ncbi:MAG: imidazolonepropionase-like amidohydrolase, partial [Maribacter sp.]
MLIHFKPNMMKKLQLFLLLSLLSIGTLIAQSLQGDGPHSQLIIRGVMLINGNGAPPQGPIDIVVENNIIKKIEVVGYDGVPIDESKRPQLKPGGKELDCNGMYLLPGFIDMHGHIGGTSQGAEPDYVFKLWMAHGITTVREPSGRGIDFALDLKRKSAKNEIIAPRIQSYTGFGQTSKTFNPLNDIPISTTEQAREWVRANAKKGADGIKFFGAEP